jgi:hypothetical protein
VNRHLPLLALLAIALAACGTQQSTATLTPESTPEPTSPPVEPTAEPTATSTEDDGGGETGSLEDVIPDELNGVAGTPIPGMDAIISSALQQQGLDAGDAEFAFVTYGAGTDAVVLTAFRIPGVEDTVMQQLALMMSGAGAGANSGLDTEEVTIDGRTVLSFSGGQTPGTVYFYVADGIAFTVVGENEGLAEQLVTELP